MVAVVLVLLVAAAITWRGELVAIAGSWLAVGVLAVVLPWVPTGIGQPGSDAVTIAVANVAFDNDDPAGVVADIVAVGADVVVVPEVTTEIDERLRAAFPHVSRTMGDYDSAGLGIYAELPLEHLPDDGVFDPDRVERVRVGGAAPFVLWGAHLPRPWFHADFPAHLRPRGQSAVVDELLSAVEDEDLPTVLAGDLNLSDRGRGYRRVADHLDDAMRSSWAGPTSRKADFVTLLLRIDHVFVPEGWCADQARRFDLAGSDHRGIAVRIGPCR